MFKQSYVACAWERERKRNRERQRQRATDLEHLCVKFHNQFNVDLSNNHLFNGLEHGNCRSFGFRFRSKSCSPSLLSGSVSVSASVLILCVFVFVSVFVWLIEPHISSLRWGNTTSPTGFLEVHWTHFPVLWQLATKVRLMRQS